VLAHTRFERSLHDGLVALRDGAGRQRGLELLREAAKLEPEHALPPLLLGAFLGSESELGTALSRNPRSLQAMLELGSALLARGEARLALPRFLAAAELAPGYEMPYVHASLALQRLGAVKEAQELEQLAEQLAAPVIPRS
jgi:tetratricopeptide (TPR) repeat protein